MKNIVESPILTFDTDWAPDFVIEYVANILIKKKVRNTWFITHDFPFLEKMKENSLFEIGIHPNFYSDSTQGSNFDLVLKNLKKIVPDAKSARSHSLLQSNHLLQQFQRYGIENDVSLILPKTKKLVPHFSKYFNLYRFPFFWEDDFEMAEESDWSINHPIYKVEGMKIFNFHPIHIYLNSKNMDMYDNIKNDFGLSNLNENNIQKFKNNDEPGTDTFFDQITEYLSKQKTFTIQDLRENYNDFF